MAMINPTEVNEYLKWAQMKKYFPSEHTPEDYVEELLNIEARTRVKLLTEYFERNEELELDVIRAMIFDKIDVSILTEDDLE